MILLKRLCWIIIGLILIGCTPGAATLPSANNASVTGKTVTINVNLTSYASSSTPAGTGGGYSPAVTNVNVGDGVRFTNTDGTGINHTATLIPGVTTYPASSPFTASATTQSGTQINQSWSTGTLQPGSTSQTISINASGTYIFGCFYHYGSPMRGEIVAI